MTLSYEPLKQKPPEPGQNRSRSFRHHHDPRHTSRRHRFRGPRSNLLVRTPALPPFHSRHGWPRPNRRLIPLLETPRLQRMNRTNPAETKLVICVWHPIHVLAPATGDAANDPRPLARNARPPLAQLRSPRRRIARHGYFRRLLPPRRTAHARQKTKVDSLHRRRRSATDVSRTPRFRNRRHQSQRRFLSTHGRAHHGPPPRARPKFPRFHPPSRPLALGPARYLGQAAASHRTKRPSFA